MIIETINNWFNLSKQYFFTYKNGFFTLSYLANSPELMINSSKKLPFMKFDDEKQILFSDNTFLKGRVRYCKLEEGLWVINSVLTYKNNVSYTPIYDNRFSSDYYCLTLINVIESNLNNKSYEFDGYKIENNSLSFLKPKSFFINCHFKGSTENQYNIYFTKEWANNNLLSIDNLSPQVLDLFQNEKITFVNYKYHEKTFESCITNFKNAFQAENKLNLFELKKNTYAFFDVFLSSIDKMQKLEITKLNLKERLLIEKIEHYMMDKIYDKFIGIDVLASQFNISPTKLKTNFKLVYGYSLYNYFQMKQMELAKQIFQKESILIKDLAEKFNYENSSNFSKAFEKVHHILPSMITKE